jgi:2-succinyl-6-hydroxy-2,4-cyclohexadiene-1-carboxylate synthase
VALRGRCADSRGGGLTQINGLDVHVEIEGVGRPLLMLHGFTGSVRAWDAIRSELAAAARVIAVDLVGHGRTASPVDPLRYTLEWAVKDLIGLCDALNLTRVDLLGYSMGGRVALHLALAAPERVNRLILESASPGIEDPEERRRRAEADEALAERILRDGMAAFVAEWERQPLLALAPHVPEAVRERQHTLRLMNDPLGLANSLRGMGAGQQAPVWSRLGELTLPVLLMVGESDFRYRAIASRMQALLPRAVLAVVAGAGHTVHVDQPTLFVRHVTEGLRSLGGGTPA